MTYKLKISLAAMILSSTFSSNAFAGPVFTTDSTNNKVSLGDVSESVDMDVHGTVDAEEYKCNGVPCMAANVSTNEGFVILNGEVLMVWGEYQCSQSNTEVTTSFPTGAEFDNSEYSVTATPHPSDTSNPQGRAATYKDRAPGSVIINTWYLDDSPSGTCGTYFAIGKAAD